MKQPNKALHLTAIPLRAIAAGELGRYLYIFLTDNFARSGTRERPEKEASNHEHSTKHHG
ncbi:MAG TPA: hypothetical protein ENL07_06630 [Chlorobaculum parvum]|uniref:Uncharacterized protein n=1 Tax=Chlorobaculum parvum TaxID=274539 RepID=A0A7C5DIP9_9CHLB|nr:hypothetical protein [Chlorobaculum parvum]